MFIRCAKQLGNIMFGQMPGRVWQGVSLVIQVDGQAIGTYVQDVSPAQLDADKRAKRVHLVVHARLAAAIDDEVAAVFVADLAMDGLDSARPVVQDPIRSMGADRAARGIEDAPGLAAFLQGLRVVDHEGKAVMGGCRVHVRRETLTGGGRVGAGCSRKLVQPNCVPLAS